jgi:hypothetical protein
MTSLVSLLTPRYAPIQSCILSCLDIGDIVALSRTCRALTNTYPTFKTLNFNINEHLKLWFNDPCAFRSVQGQCNALITDSLATEFFMRKRKAHRRTRLSIYVSENHVTPLHEYLELESYTRLVWSDPNDWVNRHRTLFRKPYDGSWLEVRVHHLSLPALNQHLRRCVWTTALFNFISWNKAYCIFPYHMFVEHTCFSTNAFAPSEAPKIEYLCSIAEVSVKTIEQTLEERGKLDAAIISPRRIGDKHTWVVDLSTDGVSVPETPDIILESSMFQLCPWKTPYYSHLAGQSSRCGLDIYYELLVHPILNHHIIALDCTRGPYSSVHRACLEISKQLCDWTIQEVKDLVEEEPANEHWLVGLEDPIPNHFWDNRVDIPSDRKVYDDRIIEALMNAWDAYDEAHEDEKLAEFYRMVRTGEGMPYGFWVFEQEMD